METPARIPACGTEMRLPKGAQRRPPGARLAWQAGIEDSDKRESGLAEAKSARWGADGIAAIVDLNRDDARSAGVGGGADARAKPAGEDFGKLGAEEQD